MSRSLKTKANQRFQKYYNPMSLDDANKLAPQIQLSKIVRSLVPADVEVDRLIVASPSYMKALAEVLDSTSKETLEAYFKWKLIQSFASAIEADELKPYTRFMNELQGKVWNSSFLFIFDSCRC
jgi:endothelin-converting enzyme